MERNSLAVEEETGLRGLFHVVRINGHAAGGGE